MILWIRQLSARGELILVNAVCFGWFVIAALAWLFRQPRVIALSSARAVVLILTELVLGAAAVAILRIRGWRLRRFGLRPTWGYTLAGAAAFVFFMISWGVVFRALCMVPLFAAVIQSQPHLTHTAWWPALAVLAVVNAVYEEAFVAAYVIQALSEKGPGAAIGISTAIRVSYHLYQGPTAFIYIGLFGLLCGAIYWRFRSAWPLIVMHAIVDAIAFAR